MGDGVPPLGAVPLEDPEGVVVPGFSGVRFVARGGNSVVYRASRDSDGVDVALKVIEGDQARIARELDALERLAGTPHVLEVLDHGVLGDGRTWIASPFAELGSAEALLRAGPLPADAVARIGAQVASALAAAHAAGVVHADVKPSNLLLDASGDVLLSDFGIARLDPTATGPATMSMTLLYTAPEVLEGAAPSERSDIYSLGLTLYALVTGQSPFADAAELGLSHLVARITQGPPPTPPGTTPGWLTAIIDHCCATDPDQRYQHPHHITDDLSAKRRPPRSHRRRLGRQRRRKALRGMIVGLVLLGSYIAGDKLVDGMGRPGGYLGPALPENPLVSFSRQTAIGQAPLLELLPVEDVGPWDGVPFTWCSNRRTDLYDVTTEEGTSYRIEVPKPAGSSSAFFSVVPLRLDIGDVVLIRGASPTPEDKASYQWGSNRRIFSGKELLIRANPFGDPSKPYSVPMDANGPSTLWKDWELVVIPRGWTDSLRFEDQRPSHWRPLHQDPIVVSPDQYVEPAQKTDRSTSRLRPGVCEMPDQQTTPGVTTSDSGELRSIRESVANAFKAGGPLGQLGIDVDLLLPPYDGSFQSLLGQASVEPQEVVRLSPTRAAVSYLLRGIGAANDRDSLLWAEVDLDRTAGGATRNWRITDYSLCIALMETFPQFVWDPEACGSPT